MHDVGMAETVSVIRENILARMFTQHVVVNVAKIVNMRNDSELRESVLNSDIINIDGMGVVYAIHYLSGDRPERVAGIDLFLELLKMAEEERLSVYFLGAKSSTLETAVENLSVLYPSLIVAGYHHGYFWSKEEQVVHEIKKSGARLIFVAITSPKKERFINRWREELGVDFAMGVGGTFDVVAGKVKRAPLWMQINGLEWFYRVCQEPRRLFSRYFYTNFIFLILVLRQKFFK